MSLDLIHSYFTTETLDKLEGFTESWKIISFATDLYTEDMGVMNMLMTPPTPAMPLWYWGFIPNMYSNCAKSKQLAIQKQESLLYMK